MPKQKHAFEDEVDIEMGVKEQLRRCFRGVKEEPPLAKAPRPRSVQVLNAHATTRTPGTDVAPSPNATAPETRLAPHAASAKDGTKETTSRPGMRRHRMKYRGREGREGRQQIAEVTPSLKRPNPSERKRDCDHHHSSRPQECMPRERAHRERAVHSLVGGSRGPGRPITAVVPMRPCRDSF